MRTEEQVLKQMLDYAETHAEVRAVLHNGSRVNPMVVKDLFCDYDAVYIVTDPAAFLHNRNWIREFGEILMLQQNTIRENNREWYIFLMLFQDGIRIDLSFMTADDYADRPRDSLTKVLLDKDRMLPPMPEPSEETYYVTTPTQAEFDSNVNNFWWCSTNVAKGLWRKELPYAKYMLDVIVRDNLLTMLAWYAASGGKKQINVGKAGKWLERLLPGSIWESYVRTYAGGDYEEIWEALLEAGRLARTVGVEVAAAIGYHYPMGDDERVTAYLHRVRRLPPDALEIPVAHSE